MKNTKAVILFPGGLGSVQRFLDALMLCYRAPEGIHRPKFIVFNYNNVLDGFLQLSKDLEKEGLQRSGVEKLYISVKTVSELERALKTEG